MSVWLCMAIIAINFAILMGWHCRKESKNHYWHYTTRVWITMTTCWILAIICTAFSFSSNRSELMDNNMDIHNTVIQTINSQPGDPALWHVANTLYYQMTSPPANLEHYIQQSAVMWDECKELHTKKYNKGVKTWQKQKKNTERNKKTGK